ncbi:MAG: YbaB/EbfC family nucleoid-associated protein [Bacilli bacterium]|nr:YbaB/EbfC family nucleoid-associated protein [Bacilli bacterium]
MNMNNIMAQAQKMQKDIEKKQQEINNSEYEGHSQSVDIVLYGSKKIKSITIKNKESLEAEDLEMLEDMIKIAFNDAVSKIEADIEAKLGMYAKLGGLM